jgi:hypothetical protein
MIAASRAEIPDAGSRRTGGLKSETADTKR